jgi:GDP-L-fucose synthase
LDNLRSNFWKGKRVLVTGGSGFLGKHIVPKLQQNGSLVIVPRSRDYDLRKEADVRKLFTNAQPQIVIHLAVNGGGIGYMRKHPATVYDDNILMNTYVLEQSRQADVEKFVGIGTVCEYPKFTPVPFKEEDLWNGYPEETNASYGLSKRMMLVQTQAYKKEYGFNGIHLLLVNMYGPFDDFDSETSHVIPALIQKFVKAQIQRLDRIEVWGTGKASREFLYVEDAADAIILATEKYKKPDPINIGTGKEITIRNLVSVIANIIGYTGSITWDTTKPDGQPTRCLDISKAKNEFGFIAKTDFTEGLKKTIEWYTTHMVQ